AGTGVAARHGILIKDAEALETAQAIRSLAFDKTGTLTEGRAKVDAVIPRQGNERELLALAAGIQHGSTHPLALAVLEAARDAGIEAAAAENITVLAGRGVRAAIDGAQLWLGSRRL